MAKSKNSSPKEISETASPKGGRVANFFGPLQGPELVFAVVGAVGTELTTVCEVLAEHLSAVRYNNAIQIRLSELLRSFEENKKIPKNPLEKRTTELMDAGDNLRKALKRGDAVALVGVAAIRSERKKKTGDEKIPAERQAYILQSLKLPEEVSTLRRIYGRAFYLIAAFSPRETRVSSLASSIAKSHHDFSDDSFRSVAETLITRDEQTPLRNTARMSGKHIL